MGIELCDGFTPLDQAALAALDRDALVAQYEARLALFEYVDAMWAQAKAGGHDPTNDSRYGAVAALRDLTGELLANTENAGGGD
ncbi:hypothetical protein ACXC9Q_04160 [Kribbella sp. CWNU-51]